MNFSIIIPSYNGSEFLTPCLNSLKISLNLAKISDYEIIIVDNGSTDDSVLKIKEFINSLKIAKQSEVRPWRNNCKLIINTSNLGFAAAVNQGIMTAKYDYVVLVNNDLTVDRFWFQKISSTIYQNTDTSIAVFCGTVLNRDGTRIESRGLEFFMRGKCLNINNYLPFRKSYITNHKSKLIWGSSAALAVYQKKIIQKIGLFDKDFFAYEEDVDLSFRLNRLGYHTLLTPSAISYHLGGGTSNRMGNFRQRQDFKNWIFLIIKNYSRSEFLNNLVPIIEERLRNLSGLVKSTPFFKIPSTLISIHVEILKNLPKMLQKRQRLKKLIANC